MSAARTTRSVAVGEQVDSRQAVTRERERSRDGQHQGSKTEQNLLKAFAGESQARNRYVYAAKVAKKEGFEQICALFTETAENEQQHAKMYFSFLEGGRSRSRRCTRPARSARRPRTCSPPPRVSTRSGASSTRRSPTWPRRRASRTSPTPFRQIAKAEAWHEKRYRKLLDNVENGTVFEKPEKVKWICRKCGYVHEGTKAINKCPACDHPQAYQEVYAENF